MLRQDNIAPAELPIGFEGSVKATQECRVSDIDGARDADPSVAHAEERLMPHTIRDAGLLE